MAISPGDRQIINNENSRRATNNLTPLSLDMMVDFLQNRVVDQLNYDRIYEIRQAKPRDKQVVKKSNKPQGMNKPKNLLRFIWLMWHNMLVYCVVVKIINLLPKTVHILDRT